MLFNELLTEAQASTVGRKYQHLEDLVYTNGSQGALHAIERLKRLMLDYESVEVKWDGSPVLYWGRDAAGKFYMFPKNAWAYQARGKDKVTGTLVSTVMDSPENIRKFISATGKPTTPEDKAQREAFSRNLAGLFRIFENATPSSFRGFVEGGLLWSPFEPYERVKLGGQIEYKFTPNVTTFYVRASSALGLKMQHSRAGVAVTGYYTDIGSTDEQRLDPLVLKSLNITDDLVVQGPIYVETAPKIDVVTNNALGELEKSIVANRQQIDNYLAPKPGLKSPGSKIYDFMGDQRATKFVGLLRAFPQWVREHCSDKQQEYLLDSEGAWKAVVGAVAQIMSAKDQVVKQWLKGLKTHSVIRQENPEGFAQPHQGGYQYDLPDQFVKYIKRSDWQPR